MEGKQGYEGLWAIAQTAILVQPTSAEHVIGWLNSHLKDAPCATHATIQGAVMKVVRRENGKFDLELAASSGRA